MARKNIRIFSSSTPRRAGFADVVEEHVRHVVGDHGAEVEGVAAVPLAAAGPSGDRELETRLLVPCKGDADSHTRC